MTIEFRAPFLQLQASMRELRDYFSVVRKLERLRRLGPFGSDGSEHESIIRSLAPTLASPSWRRQYYSSVIVKLYGIHERFVRDLTEGMANFLAHTHKTYGDLSPRIRSEHLQLTVAYLQELAGRSSFDQTAFQTASSQLEKCLSGIVSLNDHVMSRHTANLRVDVVRRMLGRFDISLPDATPILAATLSDVLNGFYSTVESVVDDLANRRNEAAHGSESQILDVDILLRIADVVYQYDAWIMRTAAKAHLDGLVDREALTLGSVDRVWADRETGRRTVARLFDVARTVLSGSDAYVVGKEITPCKIVEIQRQNVRIAEAKPTEGPFGINFDIPVHENNKLKSLPSQWQATERALLTALEIKPEFSFFEDHD